MALTKVNTDLLEDGGKLDGIEAGADVTDTTNVTAAGALMDSELTSIASVKALNQGVATTDSPTFAGLTTSADVSFGDNDKAIFGAGSDLQIYHDGSNSYISEVGTGELVIQARDAVTIEDGTSGDNYMYMQRGNKVSLFYAGAEKLATTATGIDVTGSVTADGQLTSARGSDTGTYGFRHEGAGKYLRMGVPNASFAYFETDANGGFSFEGNVTVPNQILHAGDTDTYMQFHAINEWRVVAGGYERFAIGPHVVVNEDSHDSDFRVESNGHTHALFVDGGNNVVGIDTSAPDYLLDVGNGSSSPAGGKVMRLNSDGDTIFSLSKAGTSLFSMRNNANSYTALSSNSGADLLLGYSASGAGAIVDHLRFRAASTVFNEDGADRDFRVESDGNANMLHVDGGNNSVGIGTTGGTTGSLIVQSNSGAGGISVIGRSNGGIGGLSFYDDNGSTSVGYMQGRADDAQLRLWGTQSGGNVSIGQNNTERLKVTDLGNTMIVNGFLGNNYTTGANGAMWSVSNFNDNDANTGGYVVITTSANEWQPNLLKITGTSVSSGAATPTSAVWYVRVYTYNGTVGGVSVLDSWVSGSISVSVTGTYISATSVRVNVIITTSANRSVGNVEVLSYGGVTDSARTQ